MASTGGDGKLSPDTIRQLLERLADYVDVEPQVAELNPGKNRRPLIRPKLTTAPRQSTSSWLTSCILLWFTQQTGRNVKEFSGVCQS